MKVTVSIFGKLFVFNNVPDWDEEKIEKQIRSTIKKHTKIVSIEEDPNPFTGNDVNLEQLKNIFGMR